jgi:hypothetical protein
LIQDADLEPVPPLVRKTFLVALLMVAIALLSAGICVALVFGSWHPLPETAFGCSLHKRLHSIGGVSVRAQNTIFPTSPTNCLAVTVIENEVVIRDVERIAAIRAWLDARSDGWQENFLSPPDRGVILVKIRRCTTPAGSSESYVYADEDWLGYHPSKRLQRPICRGEWRELAALALGRKP